MLTLQPFDVFSGEKLVAQMRYTYRHRRGMSRLLRKLERRLPRKEGQEIPPDWLESVEHRASRVHHWRKRREQQRFGNRLAFTQRHAGL